MKKSSKYLLIGLFFSLLVSFSLFFFEKNSLYELDFYSSETSQPITVGSSSSINQNIDINFDFKINGLKGDYDSIFQTSALPNAFWLRIIRTGGIDRFEFGIPGEQGAFGILDIGRIPALGVWHNINFIKRSHHAKLYLNNKLVWKGKINVNASFDNIIVGTHFLPERAFNGEVQNFYIKTSEYNKAFFSLQCILSQIIIILLFIGLLKANIIISENKFVLFCKFILSFGIADIYFHSGFFDFLYAEIFWLLLIIFESFLYKKYNIKISSAVLLSLLLSALFNFIFDHTFFYNVILFVLGVIFYQIFYYFCKLKLNVIIFYLIFFVSLFILFLHYWIKNKFGIITFEQIQFVLSLPIKGTSNEVIYSFIKDVVGYSLFFVFLLYFLLEKSFCLSFIIKKIKINYICYVIIASFIIYGCYNIHLVSSVPFYNTNLGGNKLTSKSIIAHAGGSINNDLYTNSKEALESSITKGFKLIELDVLVSLDNRIVAAHDWNSFSFFTIGDNSRNFPINADEFKNQTIMTKYTPLIDTDILSYMDNNDFVLVTDKISDYSLLKSSIRNIESLVVEVFSLTDVLKAQREGIKYAALNYHPGLEYSYGKKKDFFNENVNMVTTSVEHFLKNKPFFYLLHKKGIAVFVYVVNDLKFVNEYVGTYCSAVYSDYLTPLSIE